MTETISQMALPYCFVLALPKDRPSSSLREGAGDEDSLGQHPAAAKITLHLSIACSSALRYFIRIPNLHIGANKHPSGARC
jgi:hypothetical protein